MPVDPEKKAEADKRYAKKHRKKINAYLLKYYHAKNRKEYYRKRYQNNIEKYRQLHRAANTRARLEILEYMGNKCKICSFNDWRALQIDHINSDGNIDRATMGHGSRALYKRIKKNPKRYQLLCANCNWIKRYEARELFSKKS